MNNQYNPKKRTYNYDVMKKNNPNYPFGPDGDIIPIPKKQRATKWLRYKDQDGVWHFKLRGDNQMNKNYDYK